MKRTDLQALEALMMKEVVKRRALGGYSVEAEGVLHLAETVLRVLQHLIETYPELQPRGKKNAVSKGDK